MINLFLTGFAYVIIIYFMAMMTKSFPSKGRDGSDDGDGGVENLSPPKIDLPPGVIWPEDSPKKTKPDPVEI